MLFWQKFVERRTKTSWKRIPIFLIYPILPVPDGNSITWWRVKFANMFLSNIIECSVYLDSLVLFQLRNPIEENQISQDNLSCSVRPSLDHRKPAKSPFLTPLGIQEERFWIEHFSWTNWLSLEYRVSTIHDLSTQPTKIPLHLTDPEVLDSSSYTTIQFSCLISAHNSQSWVRVQVQQTKMSTFGARGSQHIF